MQTVCAERARYVYELQNWSLMPREETAQALREEIEKITWAAWTSQWGALRRVDKITASRRWWRSSIVKARSLLTALLPLAAVAVLRWLAPDLPSALASTLWTVAIIWLVVNLVTGLDPQFVDKLSVFKDIRAVLKQGKE
jgi:hypothetical protein